MPPIDFCSTVPPTMSSLNASRPKNTRRTSSHRSTLSIQKTEIKINIYDLLPVSLYTTFHVSSTCLLVLTTYRPKPGKLSSLLWTIGGSLLHSGVVVNDREYAYGGHDRPGVSGVYWTRYFHPKSDHNFLLYLFNMIIRPRLEPPGGTFRCEILHGFTFSTDEELEEILREVSDVVMPQLDPSAVD